MNTNDASKSWLRRFAELRVDPDPVKGRAPHKPLLLLAVLDLFEESSFTDGWLTQLDVDSSFTRTRCFGEVGYWNGRNSGAAWDPLIRETPVFRPKNGFLYQVLLGIKRWLYRRSPRADRAKCRDYPRRDCCGRRNTRSGRCP